MSPSTPLNTKTTPTTPDSARYGSDPVYTTPVRQPKGQLEVEADRAKRTTPSSRSDIYSGAFISKSRNASGSDDPRINSLHFEIGKLQAQLENKAQEVRKLEMERSILNHVNEDLREENAALHTQLRRVNREKDDLGDRLMEATKASAAQSSVESNLRDQLEKASKTIKVQSDQIAAPRESATSRFTPKHTNLNHGTAQHQGTPPGSFNEVYQQPPPNFDVPRAATPSRYKATQSAAYHNQPMQHYPLAMRKQPSERLNPFEAEDNATKHPPTTPLSITAPYRSHDHTSRRLTETPLPSSNPWQEDLSNGTLSMQQYNGYRSVPVNLMPALTQFFSTVETWAKRYANVPDREADMKMPQDLYARLHEHTNPAIAMSLIATSSTRYFSITKLILHECAEFAFRPMIMKGFRAEYDNKMYSCRKRVYTGINYHERREILATSTGIVEEMMGDTGWEEFIGRTTQHKTNQTWQMLLPLFASGVVHEEAWSALHSIWKEAMRIGLLMMQKVSIFAVDFPPVGPSSYFIPASMVNRDPSFTQSPMTLGQMGLKVRLAISPLVTETNFEGSGNMAPRNLHVTPSIISRSNPGPINTIVGFISEITIIYCQRHYQRHAIYNKSASNDGADMPTCLTSRAQWLCRNSIKYANFYRAFHDYFVTHLPSSSLHPDSRSSSGPHHQLPRSASKPHHSKGGPAPAPLLHSTRDSTVVRIPLRSAKHHFGVSVSRGTRPHNEDAYQAGVIHLPAFAKRAPINLTRAPANSPLQAYREQQIKKQEEEQGNGVGNGEGTSADGVSGDPQVFYFGVFDGHGGAECSGYLSDRLHRNIEETAQMYGLKSTLERRNGETGRSGQPPETRSGASSEDSADSDGTDSSSNLMTKLVSPLLKSYKENIGGYFRRFSPPAFSSTDTSPSIITVLTHAFLQTDLTFLLAQLRLTTPSHDDRPINYHDSLYSNTTTNNNPTPLQYIPTTPFRGGSTASVALISTPTPTPFWHPSTSSTLITAHVGDTRILLSRVFDGAPIPLTTDHHPSTPSEASRLRRWATTFVTDSFGEERMSGLANTRAFGDISFKRMGVSAEPEIRSIELKPSEYAFMVMVSDGVSGVMSDQEIIDTVKEAKTPELGAWELI
ncbi:MAG: hypothetical protein Q9217_004212, partial [Psora testacea]